MGQTDFPDYLSVRSKALGAALNAIEARLATSETASQPAIISALNAIETDVEATKTAVDAVTTAVDAQKVTWTENQSLTFDDATPAKTVEGKASIDLAANEYKKIVAQITIVFGGSADGNAEIRVRKSADSGTTKDTELAAGSTEITYSAGNTKRITLEFNEIPWVEIGVYNGNTAAEDITISGIYAGLKYES